MGIIAWVIFGAIAGWLASLIVGSQRQGCITNVVIGVVGAFIGGFLMETFTGRSVSFDFNLRSMVVAVIGSVVLLAVVNALQRRSR